MDNLDLGNPGPQDLNEPISLDGPIPFDNISPGESGVSHAPLDLGGASPVQTPKAAAPQPAAKPSGSTLTGEKPAGKIHRASMRKMSSVRKIHPQNRVS